MKKISFLILFCLIIGKSFSQCNLKYEKDQFNGLESWSTNFEAVARTMRGTLKLRLNKYVDKADTILYLNVWIAPMSMICINDDSKVLIKSGENIITVNLNDDIECASQGDILIGSGEITPDIITNLRQSFVDAIRIYFSETYIDFTVKNNRDYFVRNMLCFE